MRNYQEWVRDKQTKTITITCKDNDDTLEDLINHIKKVGNTGHTFLIDVEGKKFEWDGDGSDSIFDIKVSRGGGLRLSYDVEGEPVEVGD
jgi:hypothetical protein